MKENAPFFIIGTERSGSNLLRLILNSHPALCVPHPPHILKYFAPLAASYGDLDNPGRLARLVADVRGLITAHIHPWERIPSQAEILSKVTKPSLVGVFFAVYDCYCRQAGKRRWGCKSTFVIDHHAAVLAANPRARFLWLVRDPRDVAASSRRSIFSPCHPWFTARLWQRQQAEGRRALAAHPENFLLVRYEDLLADPEATVRRLCDFLAEEYVPTMLEYHRSEAAQQSSGLSVCWRNTGQPIRTDNHGRYRQQLSRAEIRLVEFACGDQMERLGYPRETGEDATTRPGVWRRGWFRLQDLGWRLRVEARAWRQDHNYWLHWRRRFFLLRLRLAAGCRRSWHVR